MMFSENLSSPNIKTNICNIENLKSIIHCDNACNLMEINICGVHKNFYELCIILDNTSIKLDIVILVEA